MLDLQAKAPKNNKLKTRATTGIKLNLSTSKPIIIMIKPATRALIRADLA